MSETLLYKFLAQLEKPEISTGFLPDFRLVKIIGDTVNVIFSKSWEGVSGIRFALRGLFMP